MALSADAMEPARSASLPAAVFQTMAALFLCAFFYSGFLPWLLGEGEYLGPQIGLVFLFALMVTADVNERFLVNLVLVSVLVLAFVGLGLLPHLTHGVANPGKALALILVLVFAAFAASYASSRPWMVSATIRMIVWFAGLVVLGALLLGLSRGSMGEERLSGEGGNPIWIARAAGTFVLFQFLHGFRRTSWALVLPLAAAGMLVILLSGSRGPLVALVLTMGIFLLARAWTRPSLLVKSAAVAGIAALIVIPLLPPVFAERVGSFVTGEFTASDSDRLHMLSMSGDLFLGQPLGRGIGSFATHSRHAYPHNIALESLVELGWPFSMFLFSMLALAGVAGLHVLGRKVNLMGAPQFLAALFFYSMFNAMFSGNLTSPKEMYFAMFALLLSFARSAPRQAAFTPASGGLQR